MSVTKFEIYCFLSAVILVAVECQREPALPLSGDSFRQILRTFQRAPEGRKTQLSDIRINYYSESKGANASYPIGNIDDLLSNPSFDLQKPTVIYVYGYVEMTSDYSVSAIVDAYIDRGGYNILVLDWANCAYGDYINALLNVKPVGTVAGKALLTLLKGGLNIKGLHIVGHSLGVHVAAVMARYLKNKGYAVSRLTGLDAAYPGFYPAIFVAPISSKDAEFVDIIHTDGGGFGAPNSIGHADFWPNHGTANQPGCLPHTIPLTVEDLCSHWRSWRYWAESVRGGNFIARKCNDYDAFLRGDCGGTAYMGLAATQGLRGNFYLRTAAQEPFALGERGAV